MQIIGEAASRLSAELRMRHPEVPWRSMAGMRHAIVHAYYEVDWNEVYGAAIRDVPPLKPLIQAILVSLPAKEDSA